MLIWLEPFNSRIIKALLLIGLALLAIAALFGLWQVITNPGLEVAQVNLNKIFIIICTMLAAFIFALFYLRLVTSYLSFSKL